MNLSEHQRAELQSHISTGAYDGSVEARAKIVLWHDEGYNNAQIARMAGTTPPTVAKWLTRYEDFGIEGLINRTSPGSPLQIPSRVRARVLALTRETPPEHLGISHWTSPQMARYIKLTEGVYVSQTWVKSQVQALDRTQPMLPVDFGKTAKRTHDYVRNGTTDLYACQDVRTGKVTVNLSATHTTADFLRLMDAVVKERREEKIHVILDNASPHKSEDAKKWLAKHNGRVVFHFTPTGASWRSPL